MLYPFGKLAYVYVPEPVVTQLYSVLLSSLFHPDKPESEEVVVSLKSYFHFSSTISAPDGTELSDTQSDITSTGGFVSGALELDAFEELFPPDDELPPDDEEPPEFDEDDEELLPLDIVNVTESPFFTVVPDVILCLITLSFAAELLFS